MTLTELRAICLRDALIKLLGKPTEGTMAYVRCLPVEAMRSLSADRLLQLPGWEVYFVSDRIAPEQREITADKAVDLREEKLGSVLLLVDPRTAGAGMDGIYSAVREIGEAELLSRATDIAEKKLEPSGRAFAHDAVRQASRVGRANSISPWRAFDFYIRCANEPELMGVHVALLGLWPIETGDNLRKEDLAISSQMVERLLLPASAAMTVQARVKSLLLPISAEDQAAELEQFLRNTSALRWTEAIVRASEKRTLRLNVLQPGFTSEEIRSIELMPWRSKPDAKPYVWSGLKSGEDNVPEFQINEAAKLEVRWKVQPPNIKAGSVEYKVSIVTGSDTELVSRQVTHTGKANEKCVFTSEDFVELDEGGKWEVKVRVHPVGEEAPQETSYQTEVPRWRESEEFILTFGVPQATAQSGVGKKARAFVEEAIKLSAEEFEIACLNPITEDSHGHISFRAGGKSGRVYRPPLIKVIEEDWQRRGFQIGRWIVRVRMDGSRAAEPEFRPVERGKCDASLWSKLEDHTRQMAQRASERLGFIGIIHYGNEQVTANYVNTWTAILDAGGPQLALANTIEIQTLNGTTIGLIVLPAHAIRVAWHSAYDELAYHARFVEELKAAEVVNTLKTLDGSYVPAFLPGLEPHSSFVFGDMLGFYAVAMIRDDEREPQASIAQMVRCLSATYEGAAPTVSTTTASAIARELDKYAKLHPQYRSLHIHALRSGDGQTIAQALGLALRMRADSNGDDSEHNVVSTDLGFILNLFPSAESNNPRLVGRFLAETAERRRAGAGGGGIASFDDRWMLETYEVDGMNLPRLKWAKRDFPQPTASAHISVAFDIFDSAVVSVSEDTMGESRPLEAFGLIPSIVRRFTFDPVPTWTTTIAMQVEGDKHPAARRLSERLQEIQKAIMRATGANKQSRDDGITWAVLETRLKAEQLDFVRRLHELSDWVVTVDRNAGIEYFDAPSDATEVYETYVIDCVPERQDLDAIQLITSTSKIDEVLQLLEGSLSEMALSCSPRNGRFLLSQLKAISGRLAMRLADRGQGRSEMIALAMLYARSAVSTESDESTGSTRWLSPRNGFFVPLDDVRELLAGERWEQPSDLSDEESDRGGMLRADLVYVDLSKRGLLRFTFIEIKYRRLLKSARDPKLHEYMLEQIAKTRKRWMETYFSNRLTQTQLVIRRKRLARALRFYLDKASRHLLVPLEHKRISSAVDKLFRSETDVASDLETDRGYIFCPEYVDQTEQINPEGIIPIYIFGPQGLPDVIPPAPGPPDLGREPVIPKRSENELDEATTAIRGGNRRVVPPPLNGGGDLKGSLSTTLVDNPPDADQMTKSEKDEPTNLGTALVLGRSVVGDVPVSWEIAITGNPHLMIVGLPGMGKTTCIINLCTQLMTAGIKPVIFSYHNDIETKLADQGVSLQFIDIDNGLGFNPLKVVTTQSHAWLDNVGRLRDIFAAIYPDLGEIQLNELREAIKKSYVDLGYGSVDEKNDLPVPEFGRFFEILRAKPKPNPGLIARLDELNDYGFFRSLNERSSILQFQQPTVIRVHATQNDALQNAIASFVLLNIYQNMLIRGTQPELTHAIIFDEAHRASRLKLLPTMAKESRKFGLAMIVASQESRDFSGSLYAAIANYLVLRVTEADAKALAKNVARSTDVSNVTGRLKELKKYTAMFFTEGKRPSIVKLSP